MNIEQIAKEARLSMLRDFNGLSEVINICVKDDIEFLRRCLKKLAERVDMEPVADVVWFDPALELFTERKPHKIIDGSLAFMDTAELGTKLYTETQLIAAQQKAAEACAKLIMDNSHDYGRYEHSETIRNGEWREYL